MLEIADKDVGGARVRRTFTRGDHRYKAGDYLTAADVLSIPTPNRRALSDSNFLEIYPRTVAPAGRERFMVGVGNNEYNVIEGTVINDKPLNRKDAERLVHGKS